MLGHIKLPRYRFRFHDLFSSAPRYTSHLATSSSRFTPRSTISSVHQPRPQTCAQLRSSLSASAARTLLATSQTFNAFTAGSISLMDPRSMLLRRKRKKYRATTAQAHIPAMAVASTSTTRGMAMMIRTLRSTTHAKVITGASIQTRDVFHKVHSQTAIAPEKAENTGARSPRILSQRAYVDHTLGCSECPACSTANGRGKGRREETHVHGGGVKHSFAADFFRLVVSHFLDVCIVA